MIQILYTLKIRVLTAVLTGPNVFLPSKILHRNPVPISYKKSPKSNRERERRSVARGRGVISTRAAGASVLRVLEKSSLFFGGKKR